MLTTDVCLNRPDFLNLPTCPVPIDMAQGSSNTFFRGYKPRGSLARALHDKVVQDQYLSQIDKNEWYQCNLDQLPEDLRKKFVQLGPDQDTIAFLENAEKKSDWILTQIWHMLAKLFLGWFMTQTTINGWLQRGSMFVLSHSQFLKLLRVPESTRYESLIDLGAGDGKVTTQLASSFEQVYVTEISPTMRNSLQAQGFRVLDIDGWYQHHKFDVIACLNLLDRCDLPLDLLDQMRSSMKSDGLVLLAVVLPFSSYIESGSSPDHKPKQILPIEGNTFEEQVQSVVDKVLTPSGFEVMTWTRVPYLCEGDLQQSYYWLDDVVFVLKLAPNLSS